ncbi:MAG: hypothetical protein ACR2O5_08675 [Thiogranum sp.]
MNIKDKIDYPWLEEVAAGLQARIDHEQIPQALLIHGNEGTGRRALAAWFAARILGTDPRSILTGWETTEEEPNYHADLLHLNPEEDKKTLSVEQARTLIEQIRLTSHSGTAKIAIVYPADAMTTSAANSLLKTLEEPPGKSVVILISESLARLPATVISRCQRCRIPSASLSAAGPWLESVDATVDWEPILNFAGGAPFKAAHLQQEGFVELNSEFAGDLADLLARRQAPLEVARKWLDRDYMLALRWLYIQVAEQIRAHAGLEAGILLPVHLQSSATALNMHWCYKYLQDIDELKGLKSSGINVELNLTRLLLSWYGGFGQARGA